MKRSWRVVAIGTALGIAYGWLGAVLNRNPHYEPGAPAPPTGVPNTAAWAWRPPPAWLPSYLLCVVPRNGYGITRTRSGYLFKSDADRRRYTVASAALGGVAGAAVGAGTAVTMLVRRRRTR